MISKLMYKPHITCLSTDIVIQNGKTLTTDTLVNKSLTNGSEVYCIDTSECYLYDEENKTLILAKVNSDILIDGEITPESVNIINTKVDNFINDVNEKIAQADIDKVVEMDARIDDISDTIGSEEMGTDADTVKGAIAEHTTQFNDLAKNGFNGVGKSLNELTDMDNLTTEGIYSKVITLSNDILNLPLYSSFSGSQRLKIEVTYDEPTKKVITQKITYQDGVFKNRIFIRNKTKGDTIWNDWIELINSSRVVNNFTTTEKGFILDAQAGKTLYDLIGKLKYTTIVVSVSESNYYDYTIPSGTIPSGAFIIASFGDDSGNKYVAYTKRVSDTVLRVGFNTSFTGTVRINIIYNIA